MRSDLFGRSLDKTKITDFFGGVAQAGVVPSESKDHPKAIDDDYGRPAAMERAGPTHGIEEVLLDRAFESDGVSAGGLRAWAAVGLLFVVVAAVYRVPSG